MHGHVGVYLIGFATLKANLIKNSHKPVARAIHLPNFWETSVMSIRKYFMYKQHKSTLYIHDLKGMGLLVFFSNDRMQYAAFL